MRRQPTAPSPSDARPTGGQAPGPPGPPPPPIVPVGNETFVGAGDIGHCAVDGAERTGELLEDIAGTVFTLGDNAYTRGSAEEFTECYDPSWGRQKYRTKPSPGNRNHHDAPGAAPYFSYFGTQAGETSGGYYSFSRVRGTSTR